MLQGRGSTTMAPEWHGTCSLAQAPGSCLCPWLLQGWTATPPAVIPGQILNPPVTVGSLPGLGPLPSSALTAEELKYTNIHNIGASFAPLQFLEVKLGKRPQSVKTELEEEEEWRKRHQEKKKVAAAPCQSREKEQFLQRESEWLELMGTELKTQMEELKQEWQQLILMLNQHRPSCIFRTDNVKTADSEDKPPLEQLEKK